MQQATTRHVQCSTKYCTKRTFMWYHYYIIYGISSILLTEKEFLGGQNNFCLQKKLFSCTCNTGRHITAAYLLSFQELADILQQNTNTHSEHARDNCLQSR